MTLPYFCPINAPEDCLAGKTIVIPVVSVANIAQLAIDLLIASLKLKRIGIMDAEYLIPIVGARDDGEPGFTTPLEVYGKEGLDVVFVQQRSPVMKECKEEFIRFLTTFLHESKVSGILLLTGIDLSNRSDQQMISSTYKLVPTHSPPLASTPLASVLELPTYSYAPAEHIPESSAVADATIPFIPGGGLARRILTTTGTPDARRLLDKPITEIPFACILQFVVEGDNRGDAAQLAQKVTKLMAIEKDVVAWKSPPSWDAGLFGATHDQSLYG